MQITDISLNNKYTKWYINIINRARNRASTRKEAKCVLGFVEGHHVVPTSIFKNSDIVYLSTREHFIVHVLLTKMLINENKELMEYALSMFLQGRKEKLTSKQISICLNKKHKPCSEIRRKNIKQARLLTRKLTCAHCGKISDPGNFKRFHGDLCKHNPNTDIEYWKTLSEVGKKNIKHQMESGSFNNFGRKSQASSDSLLRSSIQYGQE